MNAVGSGFVPYTETVIRGFPGTGTGVSKPYNPMDDYDKKRAHENDVRNTVIGLSWNVQNDRYQREKMIDGMVDGALNVMTGGYDYLKEGAENVSNVASQMNPLGDMKKWLVLILGAVVVSMVSK